MPDLKGMLEIREFVKLSGSPVSSESTLISWIHCENFPAAKDKDGIWISQSGRVDRWLKRKMDGWPLKDPGKKSRSTKIN